MQQCFNCGVSVLPPPGYPQFRCGGCRAVNTTRLAPQPAAPAFSQPPPQQQQQRPPAPAPAAGGQPCAACTFQNAPGAALCAVCGQRLQLPRLPASPTAAAAAASAMPWSCATCTLTNAAHLKKCSVCGYTRIDGSSSSGGSSGGGVGGTLAALSAAAASPPPAQPPALASSPFASGSGGGGGGGGGGALTPRTASSRGALDPRIVFQSQGDGASPREDERCRASYQALAREVQARGPYAQFSDADFPTTPASLGGGAEVHITFAGHGKVGVPVLWRRPGSLADEAGVFQPGSPANPAAELAELVREAPLTAAAVTSSSGGGGGGGERPYRHPTRAEVSFLAEQASLRAAGGGSARGGPPWVFRRDRYACADVVQGQLGTCWFVSALAVVAEREALVAALFAAEPLRDALASAGRPCDLPDLLRGPIPLHPLGLYAVRLCIDGLWRWLTVDDRIPADAYRGQPAYTSARGRQLWVALLEKAAAKACGSYAGLAAGTLAEGLRLLTGAPVASLHVATNETEAAQRARHERERGGDFSLPASGGGGAGGGGSGGSAWGEWCVGQPPPPHVADALWVRLCSWQAAGYLMGASCGAPNPANFPPAVSAALGGSRAAWQRVCAAAEAAAERAGLSVNHAYSLLQVYQCPASGARLVQLRNPHGKKSGSGGSGSGGSGSSSSGSGEVNGWCGAWSDASAAWRSAPPATRAHCNPTLQASTGTFWMPLGDFVAAFHRLDCARVAQTVSAGDASACTRARLPLPHAAHGLAVLRLTPAATMYADCCVTDVSSTLVEGGGGSSAVRYRRAGNEWPRRDLALLVVEELTRVQVLREGSGGGGGGGVGKGAGAGAGGSASSSAAAAAAAGELPEADDWGSERVAAYRAALAASASGMRLAAGPPRQVTACAGLQCWLEAGRTYHMLPLSLAGYGAACPPSAAIVELHYPASKGLRVEVVSPPTAWLARALLCRTLSLGKASAWGGGVGGGGGGGRGDPALAASHCVSHTDGAGVLIAAVNTHAEQSFELTITVSCGSSGGSGSGRMVLARGGGRTVDCVPPLTAQLVNLVSPEIGASGWGYSTQQGVRMPAPVVASQAPPAPPGTLHAPTPLVS